MIEYLCDPSLKVANQTPEQTMKTFICMTLLIAISSLEAADSWPQFRGPNAGGVADDERPPVHFGPETNLHWKVNVPPGLSSPVVSKECVFLTAFQDGQLLTIAYSTATGRELWRRTAPAKEIERCHQFSSPAAPTPCTDGERIYVYFGSFGVLAYDFAGVFVVSVAIVGLAAGV